MWTSTLIWPAVKGERHASSGVTAGAMDGATAAGDERGGEGEAGPAFELAGAVGAGELAGAAASPVGGHSVQGVASPSPRCLHVAPSPRCLHVAWSSAVV